MNLLLINTDLDTNIIESVGWDAILPLFKANQQGSIALVGTLALNGKYYITISVAELTKYRQIGGSSLEERGCTQGTRELCLSRRRKARAYRRVR